jgi:hypothetical protein
MLTMSYCIDDCTFFYYCIPLLLKLVLKNSHYLFVSWHTFVCQWVLVYQSATSIIVHDCIENHWFLVPTSLLVSHF